MNVPARIIINEANAWRTQTPGGSERWAKTPYPGTGRPKYFMVSADSHLSPPMTLIRDRVDAQYRERVPRMERDEKGVMWTVVENKRRGRVVEADMEGEDLYRTKAGGATGLEGDNNDLVKRMADLDLDGIDAELVFPNGTAMAAYWTKDPRLLDAQLRVYNDWTAELTRPYWQRMNVAGAIATGEVALAVAEVQRLAKMGYRVVTLPTKPVLGGDLDKFNYNLPEFDALWAAIQDTDMTITFHIGTGVDPRSAKGPGGAVINLAIHGLSTTGEPVANLIMSGALDRFPKLRFAVVEGGIGWIPWLLDVLDEGYRKHHMWVSPKLKHGLPSEYFRAHGGATFGEDKPGLALAEEYGLENVLCWANDYPHHEGTFPHSAQAIERQMGGLREDTRAKILGLNAARLFKFELPAAS